MTLKSFPFVATLTLIISLSSCKKSEITPTAPVETEDPTTIPFTQQFSAIIDGIAFDAQSIGWNYNNIDSILTISAATDTVGSIADSTHFVGFTVPSNITAGTYTFDGSSIKSYYNVGLDIEDKYSPAQGTGTLIITSHDAINSEIVGTFSFLAVPISGNPNSNSYSITNGAFSIKYQ